MEAFLFLTVSLQLCSDFRAKHDFLLAELKKRSWVEKIYGDHAGLHVLVQVNTEKKETEICDLAEKQGILIYGISEYVVRKSAQCS